MAVSSKVEEIILEIARVAGKIYDTNLYGIGSVETPNSAIFEINNLFNLATYGLPYFGTIETDPLGFQISYDVANDPYNVIIGSGQVSYQSSTFQISQQSIPLKKDFSKSYDAYYKYGIVVGFPLSEAQKANSVWETTISQNISSGSSLIYINDLTIPTNIGFPLEAHVGSLYLRFIGLNDDATALKIDPSFKIGSNYGITSSLISINTPVRFIVSPKLKYVTGYPIFTTSENPDLFNYYPPLPNDWLPIAKILVKYPDYPVVAGTGNDAFIRTVNDYPTDSSSNPILGNSTDKGMVIDACNAAINDLSSFSNTISISSIVQALRLYTSKQYTNTQSSFRKFWSLQPFRASSYYSKGLNYNGLEKFLLPYNFAKAYFETVGEDTHHIFATFRGDLITYNSALMGTQKVAQSSLSTSILPCSNYRSSLDSGTQIYGVSVVSNISLTEYGESIPTYTSEISSNTTIGNYMSEINWSGTGLSNPMFYHIYKRPKLASELLERKLTYISEINYSTYNTYVTVPDINNFLFPSVYFATRIVPSENFYCGGVTIKAGFLNTADSVYNPDDYLSIGIYSSPYYYPSISTPLSSVSQLRYGDLVNGTSNEYTVKFDQGANLQIGLSYWTVITKNTDLLTGFGTTENLYIRTGTDSISESLYSSDGLTWTAIGDKSYVKLRGYLDNGSVTGETIRRGVQYTNRVAFAPQRLSVYVPPVEDLSGLTGLRYDGVTTAIASTTDTTIKNELIVTVTARNGESGTPTTFSATIPKGTTRDTRFLLGTTTDLFDRVDDVLITPGTNLTRNNNGPVLWDVYDLITIETTP